MPRHEKPKPDTRFLGLLTHMDTPGPNGNSDKPDLYRCRFDTGVELYIPPGMFDSLQFHLQEAD